MRFVLSGKLFCCALLFAALPLRGQNCLDGVFPTPPTFLEDDWEFPWRDHFTALSRLGNHFMSTFGDGDSMTESIALDVASNNPEWFGSEGLRETWYVPRDGIAGTGPLYRYYSPQLATTWMRALRATAPTDTTPSSRMAIRGRPR